ncbi:MAG: DUF86 domain-containing protein [Salinivirgaceae bacterium]|nr:DUF86 domain-containing protein [Salinivirgaceae bacterium]
MRESVRDHDRLEHIVEAIDNILEFSEGKTVEEMEANKLIYYGIVKNIEIIGEAAYKLTNAFRHQHSETLWDVIMKMRHILVHDYYQIDCQSVWKVVKEDLHPLREQVIRYLTETDWDAWEKNEVVIVETATHKSLTQTAIRMKQCGYETDEICKITGLSREEIEGL